MRRLPPLNALRAFEATARLSGVQRASEELHVTHGAISRHIKQLENWLAVTLFDRSGRSLKLNNEGKSYLYNISSAFDLIQEGTANLQHTKPANTLGISTTHSIATKWLLDRLPDFNLMHPNIEVWLSMEQFLTEFDKNGIDIAIRMGNGPWPNLTCIPLMRDRLITVCSPDLIKSKPLNCPEELRFYTLLHDKAPDTQWSRWFIENKINTIDYSKGPRFSSSDVLLKAAISGQGIALVNEVFASDDLAEGLLIKPLTHSLDLGDYFWLVYSKEQKLNQNQSHFIEWIKTKTL